MCKPPSVHHKIPLVMSPLAVTSGWLPSAGGHVPTAVCLKSLAKKFVPDHFPIVVESNIVLTFSDPPQTMLHRDGFPGDSVCECIWQFLNKKKRRLTSKSWGSFRGLSFVLRRVCLLFSVNGGRFTISRGYGTQAMH